MDAGIFFQHQAELVLRHQMRVSNYFVNSFYSVSTLSAGAYPATLYVMVYRVKEGGRVPPPSTAKADFSIMMECKPEIGHCHSV